MSQENVDLVRGIYHGWAQGDFSVGADLVTDDFEWKQHPQAVEPGSRRGEAVGASLRNLFEIYEGFRVEAEEFIDAGSRVVVVARVSATARRHNGLELDQVWGFVWTVRDGRLVRNEVYADRTEALEAAGLRE